MGCQNDAPLEKIVLSWRLNIEDHPWDWRIILIADRPTRPKSIGRRWVVIAWYRVWVTNVIVGPVRCRKASLKIWKTNSRLVKFIKIVIKSERTYLVCQNISLSAETSSKIKLCLTDRVWNDRSCL